jgi:hypothetical protein
MPERLRKQILGGLPRGWLLGCAASLAVIPALAAESLPASVRACAALTDSLQRLVCYDREVAKFPAPAAKAEKPVPGAGAAAASGGSAGVTSGLAVATTPGAQGPTAVTSGQAAAATTSAPAGTNSPAPAPKSNSAALAVALGDDHVAAHIVSIDRQSNEMILHLDNGQVWQEVQSVSGDLSLREGDAVKIDRHLGSFWLTGPHVSSMKVQRKS